MGQLTKQEQFFYDNAGVCWNPTIETQEQGRIHGAQRLAGAELWAKLENYFFTWEVDQECDSRDFSDEEPAWSLWVCTMYKHSEDYSGNPELVRVMGGIDFGRDGSPYHDTYARVMEAELALDAMNESPTIMVKELNMDYGYLAAGTKVPVKNEFGSQWLAFFEGQWRRVYIQVKRCYIIYRGTKINIRIDGV